MILTRNNGFNRMAQSLLGERQSLLLLAWCVLLFTAPLYGQDVTPGDSLHQVKVIVKDAQSGAPIVAAQARTLSFPAAGTSDEAGMMQMAVTSLDDVIEVRAYDYGPVRSEEHTSELQSRPHLVCRLLLEKKKKKTQDSQTG